MQRGKVPRKGNIEKKKERQKGLKINGRHGNSGGGSREDDDDEMWRKRRRKSRRREGMGR